MASAREKINKHSNDAANASFEISLVDSVVVEAAEDEEQEDELGHGGVANTSDVILTQLDVDACLAKSQSKDPNSCSAVATADESEETRRDEADEPNCLTFCEHGSSRDDGSLNQNVSNEDVVALIVDDFEDSIDAG